MLTIKKRSVNRLNSFLMALSLMAASGCQPPGPRALLKGEKLIQQGKHELAVEKLQIATRLLPRNAQAWNYLGLAYHGNKQPELAWRAYRHALDVDPKLAAARFNLGCLYLEQNRPAEAVDELTSYTLLQSRSVDGWLKLGTAQLRARRIDAAEKSFKSVLELAPRHPEALNNLGDIQFQRKRWPEAWGFFKAALAEKPDYGPALINAAATVHKHLNNRPAALQLYQRYLAVQPRLSRWEEVSALAAQLRAELNPPPVQLAMVAVPKPAIKTNLPPASANRAARPGVEASSPPGVVSPPARVEVVPPPKPLIQATQAVHAPKIPVIEQPAPAPLPPKPVVATSPVIPAAVTNKPTPIAPVPEPSPLPTNPIPNIEVTQVADQLVIKPAQEIAVAKKAEPARTNVEARLDPPPAVPPKNAAKPEKRSLLARLNPFRGKTKQADPAAAPVPPPALKPAEKLVVVEKPLVREVAPEPPEVRVPRYGYLSPRKPAPGNRRQAEPYFVSGVKEQQAGRLAEALAYYQKATNVDPGYFEAHYNHGLAAYETGRWKDSLASYENALASRPDSLDARYNFALALKQAGFPQDAANELLLILKSHPAEVRAHLSLANLYAQQLSQTGLAREYYLRVLENDPQHPQAARIRAWLTAHP